MEPNTLLHGTWFEASRIDADGWNEDEPEIRYPFLAFRRDMSINGRAIAPQPYMQKRQFTAIMEAQPPIYYGTYRYLGGLYRLEERWQILFYKELLAFALESILHQRFISNWAEIDYLLRQRSFNEKYGIA